MNIVNTVEDKWMTMYPWPIEIMYDRVLELLSHELKYPGTKWILHQIKSRKPGEPPSKFNFRINTSGISKYCT